MNYGDFLAYCGDLQTKSAGASIDDLFNAALDKLIRRKDPVSAEAPVTATTPRLSKAQEDYLKRVVNRPGIPENVGLGIPVSERGTSIIRSPKGTSLVGRKGLGSTALTVIPSGAADEVAKGMSLGKKLAIGAGALGLAGAGLGAKRIAAARRAAQAPVEQSIGRAVLNHLGRHKGKYAIGGAAALGLGGLMASKSASVDDMLWEKAASDGEAFLDQLASAALSDSTAQELQLFRAAALEAARY